MIETTVYIISEFGIHVFIYGSDAIIHMKTQPAAIALVLVCTVFTSMAQILFKFASFSFSLDIVSIATNYFFISGLVLYAVAAGLLIAALKRGELSVVYPVVATSYIWVSILSSMVFPTDAMTMMKWAGIFIIMAGVSFVGMGGRHE